MIWESVVAVVAFFAALAFGVYLGWLGWRMNTRRPGGELNAAAPRCCSAAVPVRLPRGGSSPLIERVGTTGDARGLRLDPGRAVERASLGEGTAPRVVWHLVGDHGHSRPLPAVLEEGASPAGRCRQARR